MKYFFSKYFLFLLAAMNLAVLSGCQSKQEPTPSDPASIEQHDKEVYDEESQRTN